MVKTRKITAIVACMLALVGMVAAAGISSVYAADEVSFTFATEREFFKNDRLAADAVTASAGETSVAVEKFLTFPSGKTVKGSEFSLSEAGVYSLSARAEYNGEVYSEKRGFTVKSKLFELQENDTAEYRNHPFNEYTGLNASVSELKGMLIKLSKGNSVTVNQAIDLSKADRSTPVIEFYVPSLERGVRDFTTVNFRFTDKYDSTKYIDVNANNLTNGSDIRGCMSWWKAASQDQKLTGIQNMDPLDVHPGPEDNIRTDNYGSYGIMSWCMTPYIDSSHPGLTYYGDAAEQNMLRNVDRSAICIDYASRRVYAGRYAGNFVTDLDDPTYYVNPWEGFTTGECYLTITADNYTADNPAQIFITSLRGVDLQQEVVTDETAPSIKVDFGGYDENALPDALVGHPYAIFPATADDPELSPSFIDVRVSGNVFTDYPFDVPVNNGSFTPTAKGWYEIKYTARDSWGNSSNRSLRVYATDSAAELKVTQSGKTESGNVGEFVPVAAASVTGAIGKASITTKVTFGGATVAVENDGFVPEKAGDYTVSVTARDYVGREATESYTVAVGVSDKPVFAELPVIQKYLLAGQVNKLPLADAYDYTGEAPVKAAVKIQITDSEGTRTLSGTSFTPKRIDSEVTVAWVATNANGSTVSKSVTLPVCDVIDGEDYRMEKYFATDGMSAKAQMQNVTLTVGKNGASAEFINPLLSENFSVAFKPVNMDRVKLVLVGYENPDEKLALDIDLNTNVALINGTRRYELQRQSGGGFYFSYTASTNMLSDGYTKVVPYDGKGNVFGGFTGGKVYMSIIAEETGENAAVEVSSVSNQALSSRGFEMIKPGIMILGTTGGAYLKDRTVTLFRAVIADVLSPSCTFHCTVTAPDGTTVKDLNGVELKEVDPEVERKILLDQYGAYIIQFYGEDQSGNRERNISYSINVIDVVAPVIKLDGEVQATASVGDKVTFASAKAYDDKDGELDVFMYVQSPDSKVLKLKDKSYTFAMKGVYVIKYYACDKTGNSTILEYTVTVA